MFSASQHTTKPFVRHALGLGWNFGLIAGTALVVDATVPANRARVQGTIDVLIALAGAGSGAMSGVIVAHTSYPILAVAGGVLSLLLIPVVFWARTRSTTATATSLTGTTP